MKILEIGGEQVNRDVLLAIARDPHQVKVFKFEGGHGVEDDLSDIFKNTNLLVSFCPASYFQVKYNPYEKRYGSFGSADDWGFDEIDDFDEDESISDDDYNDEFDIV